MDITLSDAANWAAIFGVPISLIALGLTYRSLKSDIASANIRIDTMNDIMQLNQKYNSGGAQYHNCTFNSSPLDKNQVEIKYNSGVDQGSIGNE